MKFINKIIAILILFGFLIPYLSFAQPPISAPETLEQAQEMAVKTGKELELNFWTIIKKIWQEEVLPVFQKIWNLLKKIWNSYLWPKIKWLWQKITTPIKKEFEKRKPVIKEDFQKEKQEMQQEIKTKLLKNKTLWEKFKELIK